MLKSKKQKEMEKAGWVKLQKPGGIKSKIKTVKGMAQEAITVPAGPRQQAKMRPKEVTKESSIKVKNPRRGLILVTKDNKDPNKGKTKK